MYYYRIREERPGRRILNIDTIRMRGVENGEARSPAELEGAIRENRITHVLFPYGRGAGYPANGLAADDPRLGRYLKKLFQASQLRPAEPLPPPSDAEREALSWLIDN